ncbi:MAG: DUF488 domain-containing protein, partial [Dietzia maris]
MSVYCVRVHDLVSGEADPAGAHVVLVDRLWPRGVRKDSLGHDDWCRDVAPSADLRRGFHRGELDFEHFAERYREELSRDPAAGEVGRPATVGGHNKPVFAPA